MIKNRKLIALFISMALLFTCIFPTMAFAVELVEYESEELELQEYESEELELQEYELEKEGLKEETTLVGSSDLGGYKGLVAHWKFDGDLKDSSQFKNDGVAVGGRTGITFVDSVVGKGVKLDGKSYIEVNDSASLDLSDAFTFSFWVYKDDMRKKDNMDGGVPYIIKNHEEGSDFPYAVYEWWTMTPGVAYCDADESGDIHSEKQVDLQKWTLITATYDGKTMKIYKDKEMVKSELKSTFLVNSAQPLYIGFGHFMTVDNYFKGVLDDMKIYNKALSYSEVEDMYDEVATKVPGKDLINKPNKLVAYYKFENDLKDLSGFKNDGLAVKANNFKYVDGIAGKGIKFSGASYIEVKDSDSLDLDRGFTFGMWVYKEKSKDNQPIFSKYGESHLKYDCSYQLMDWIDGTGQRLSLFNFENDGNMDHFDTDDSKDIVDGKWFYYTATYNGKALDDETETKDSNTVKLYINGKLVKTEEFDGDISNSTGPLWIGGTTDSIYFKGMMDEFRIYNYALTPTQVKTLYNMRDGLEVVPTNKKVIMASLKTKQNIQLTANLLTQMYTSPSKALPNGKDELKKLDVTTKATYKSNNAKVATVSKAGIVTTIGKGKATITVTYGKYSQIIPIVVK